MLVVDSSEEGCAVLDSNDLQAGQEVMLRACRCVALLFVSVLLKQSLMK